MKTKRMWAGIAYIFVGALISFMITWANSMLTGGPDATLQSIAMVCYIISAVIIGFGAFGVWAKDKNIMDHDTFQKYVKITCYRDLSDEQEYYINNYEKISKNEDERIALRELISLMPKLTNDYARAIMHMPEQMMTPVSPINAGILGTAVGGVAVGAVAAINAMKKEEAYKENRRAVIRSEVERGNAYERVERCYRSIQSLFNKYDKTKKLWAENKTLIEEACRKGCIITDANWILVLLLGE